MTQMAPKDTRYSSVDDQIEAFGSIDRWFYLGIPAVIGLILGVGYWLFS